MTTPEIERQERLQVTAADGTTHRFYTHDEVQAAIAAAMMGVVKPLEWKDLGLGWVAYDPLFETQVITEDRAKYDAERATRILSALSIPTDAAALDAMRVEAVAAWDAVLDRIRKLRGEGWEGAPAVHPYDKGYLAALDAMHNAIRAMKKGGE
jgi:hypothetical protein